MARRTSAVAEPDATPVLAAATVPMVREEPAHPGGPTTADVHPEEVEAMQRFGWRVVEA